VVLLMRGAVDVLQAVGALIAIAGP
jgi:hypothetical protein